METEIADVLKTRQTQETTLLNDVQPSPVKMARRERKLLYSVDKRPDLKIKHYAFDKAGKSFFGNFNIADERK